MATNKLQWKSINMGEILPCQSFLRKKDGEILKLSTIGGVKVGQDCYYLPVDEVINVIKDYPVEESEDERIINNIRKVIGWYRGMFIEKSLMPEQYQEIDAWLEKQDDKQKLDGTFVNIDDVREDFVNEVYRVLDADSTNDRANQIIDAFDDLPTVAIEMQSEQKPYGLREECKDCQCNYAGECKGSCAMKRNEQNPIKVPKFKAGDFIQFNGMGHTRYTIKEVCGLSHYINTCNKRMDMSYTDANFELVEQKSAEWHREDEHNLNACLGYIPDEFLRKWLTDAIHTRYAFKPSDEQITVCKEVYADLLSAKGFDLDTVNSELNRLEEQLKKLREE